MPLAGGRGERGRHCSWVSAGHLAGAADIVTTGLAQLLLSRRFWKNRKMAQVPGQDSNRGEMYDKAGAVEPAAPPGDQGGLLGRGGCPRGDLRTGGGQEWDEAGIGAGALKGTCAPHVLRACTGTYAHTQDHRPRVTVRIQFKKQQNRTLRWLEAAKHHTTIHNSPEGDGHRLQDNSSGDTGRRGREVPGSPQAPPSSRVPAGAVAGPRARLLCFLPDERASTLPRGRGHRVHCKHRCLDRGRWAEEPDERAAGATPCPALSWAPFHSTRLSGLCTGPGRGRPHAPGSTVQAARSGATRPFQAEGPGLPSGSGRSPAPGCDCCLWPREPPVSSPGKRGW